MKQKDYKGTAKLDTGNMKLEIQNKNTNPNWQGTFNTSVGTNTYWDTRKWTSRQNVKEAQNLDNINITVNLNRVEGKSLFQQVCDNKCQKGRHFHRIQSNIKQLWLILKVKWVIS